MKRSVIEDNSGNPVEIVFTDNFGNFVYSTLYIDWIQEVGGYTGQAMQISDEVAQWQAANSKIPGMSPEDVLQELRIHIWKQMPKYKPDKGSIRWFAQFIFKNKQMDMKKLSKGPKRVLINYALPLIDEDKE